VDNTQKIISFCTGYGGIELGLKLAGLDVRTVAYVEIEAFACANLVAKIQQGKMDAAPIWTDLKTFDGKPFRDRVHGIIGGYPCQPFSNAGQRKGTDDPRHLFPYICQHIRTIRPLWCFFENVGGHLNLGFDEVYKSLRDLGYKVEAGLFTASEVGAPHKRERLFVLGYSERLRLQGRRSKRRNQMEPDRAGEQLADSQSQRIQGNGTKGQQEPQAHAGKALSLCSGGRWPARPGQEQYEWEQPRTVESGMGRTVNGTASRVDELRLLGNGVVPQTAALAWKHLWQKISF
jgi:DNA (cytosine-5)-methyltransferase 1